MVYWVWLEGQVRLERFAMISLVQIRCPHCGAKGRMLLPPTGLILIGPCPQCHELVAVFCGQALPLDSEIMESGSAEEKGAHLLVVLTDFIESQIGEMVQQSFQAEEGADQSLDPPSIHSGMEADAAWAVEEQEHLNGPPISAEEVSYFRETELNLLDNSDYFHDIFG